MKKARFCNMVLVILAIFAVMLAGCDKDDATIDFKADDVQFDLSGIEVNSGSGSGSSSVRASGALLSIATATNSFSETFTVDISEISSSDLTKYMDRISKVVANNSLLTISVTPPNEYSVVDLKVTVNGVPGSLDIPSYTMGEDFTPPSNMNAFTAAFIMKLINAGQADVTVSGKTDAPAGTKIDVFYECDLVFTAKLL